MRRLLLRAIGRTSHDGASATIRIGGAAPQQAAAEQQSRAPDLAVLIDADNVPPDKIGAVLDAVTGLGTAHIRRAYGDWSRPHLAGWKHALLYLPKSHGRIAPDAVLRVPQDRRRVTTLAASSAA